MHQLRLFLCALQFLTRIPTPQLATFESDWITRSARFFPLVGQLVGALSAAALLLAAQLWSGFLPVLLALAVGIVITGAFHEDGLADSIDGLGGGRDRAQRLAIMKDSRIGTYGVLALLIVLALKAAALAAFTPMHAALLLIALHGAARAAAVVVMCTLPYAGDPDASKSKPAPVGVTGLECAAAMLFALWPLFLLPIPQVAWGLCVGALLAGLLVVTARRLVGGYTGDILGATEQMFEVGFLLGAAAAL